MFPMYSFCSCKKSHKMFLVAAAIVLFISEVQTELLANENELTILIGENSTVNFSLSEPLDIAVNVQVLEQIHGVVQIEPTSIDIGAQKTGPWMISITGVGGGHVLVYANVTPNVTNDNNAFIHVTVQHSQILAFISVAVGWIYFTAWSISFYPQIYENFVRKSVIGLNFDFLALNLIGFTLYAVFNCGLYWIPAIEEEYFRRHPRGLNPVQLNDIVFAVHAAIATLLTIGQCFCYERGNQRVSTTARSIMIAFLLIFITCLGLVLFNYIEWLDFLYDCSYIKLTITLIKYIPQAFMNYQRKSTVGWSIGNVLLDFTGGILSMGQMIINAYNYNDWVSIFGDPTKFGLGLFSVFFDILFILQHYVLYRNPYEPIPGDVHVQAAESEEHADTNSDDNLVGKATYDQTSSTLQGDPHEVVT